MSPLIASRPALTTAPAPGLHQAHAQQLVRLLGEPPLRGNGVELLDDGPATFAAMCSAIAGARDHINVESTIVDPAGPCAELSRLLIERSRAGVRVSLLYDSCGSIGTAQAFCTSLRDAGVALCEYHPVQRWRSRLGRALHPRRQRKLMVIDGRIAFIGGVDISKVHGAGSAPHLGSDATAPDSGWRDMHVRVEGPVVQRLQRLFIGHWMRFASCPLPQARYFPPQPAVGPQRVGVAARDAGRRANPYDHALLGAIGKAHSRILFTTAYLVPPRRLLGALLGAAQRGVHVEMLMPGVSDFWAPLHAGQSHYTGLLKAGVRIHERHDRMLHTKACVIDGVWAGIGWANADWRSLVHSAEADVVVIDEDFAGQLERAFRDDVGAARSVDAAQWAQRGWTARCREALARRVGFLL